MEPLLRRGVRFIIASGTLPPKETMESELGMYVAPVTHCVDHTIMCMGEVYSD